MDSRSHGHWSWHVTKDSLYALTKIAIINFAIIIECNDDFASISFPPCNVETEITASTIAPRNSYHIATKHPILVFPGKGSELRMIDFDTTFAVIDDDKPCPEIDKGLKIFKRNRS